MKEQNELKKFTFNNVFFKFRIFENLENEKEKLRPEEVLSNWWSLFCEDDFDEEDDCLERLYQRVGFGCRTLMTTRHFIDANGEAWTAETFIVLEDDQPTSRFALVSVIPQ